MTGGQRSAAIRGATIGACRIAAPPTVVRRCDAARTRASPEPSAQTGHQRVEVREWRREEESRVYEPAFGMTSP